MSTHSFTVLGTASQTPTRLRAHNGYVLRWADKTILFDPGEGTQRQCLFAGVSIAKLDAVAITHFHGDHCLGLPGIIQRRSLDNNLNKAEPKELPVIFPDSGLAYFDNLAKASVFHDSSNLAPTPLNETENTFQLDALLISSLPLDHRTHTIGYRVEEPQRRVFNKALLAQAGISGSDVAKLANEGTLQTENGIVSLEDVTSIKEGFKFAFVMDTALCDNAYKLAKDVDLLVCESTFAESEAELATRYKHLTAGQAGEIAATSGAKQLVLTHYSARYGDVSLLENEASCYHTNVTAAQDLQVFNF